MLLVVEETGCKRSTHRVAHDFFIFSFLFPLETACGVGGGIAGSGAIRTACSHGGREQERED